MPGNVPSLFLLPLDILTQEKMLQRWICAELVCLPPSCSLAMPYGKGALLCLVLGGNVAFR